MQLHVSVPERRGSPPPAPGDPSPVGVGGRPRGLCEGLCPRPPSPALAREVRAPGLGFGTAATLEGGALSCWLVDQALGPSGPEADRLAHGPLRALGRRFQNSPRWCAAPRAPSAASPSLSVSDTPVHTARCGGVRVYHTRAVRRRGRQAVRRERPGEAGCRGWGAGLAEQQGWADTWYPGEPTVWPPAAPCPWELPPPGPRSRPAWPPCPASPFYRGSRTGSTALGSGSGR